MASLVGGDANNLISDKVHESDGKVTPRLHKPVKDDQAHDHEIRGHFEACRQGTRMSLSALPLSLPFPLNFLPWDGGWGLKLSQGIAHTGRPMTGRDIVARVGRAEEP